MIELKFLRENTEIRFTYSQKKERFKNESEKNF